MCYNNNFRNEKFYSIFTLKMEFCYDPLLPRLELKELLLFTSCNKHLYSISEKYLKEEGLKDDYIRGYFEESSIKSYRYILSLLKYGKKKVPVILNICDKKNVNLEYKYYMLLTAEDCAINSAEEYVFYGFNFYSLRDDSKIRGHFDHMVYNYRNCGGSGAGERTEK